MVRTPSVVNNEYEKTDELTRKRKCVSITDRVRNLLRYQFNISDLFWTDFSEIKLP